MGKKQLILTEVEREVLGELDERLGVHFVVGKEAGKQRRVILSEKRVKVRIADPELKQRLLDKKPVSYQTKYIKCGKEDCSKCPHGPYVYVFWRMGAKVRSIYLGRVEW